MSKQNLVQNIYESDDVNKNQKNILNTSTIYYLIMENVGFRINSIFTQTIPKKKLEKQNLNPYQFNIPNTHTQHTHTHTNNRTKHNDQEKFYFIDFA